MSSGIWEFFVSFSQRIQLLGKACMVKLTLTDSGLYYSNDGKELKNFVLETRILMVQAVVKSA